MTSETNPGWHGTTILSVRKDGQVVIAGDGQVTLGQTVIKANARKVRRIGDGSIVTGFAGATALADLTTRKPLPEMQAAPAKKSSHGSKDEHRKPIEAEVGLRRCPGRRDQTNGCRSVGLLSTIEFALRVFESVYGIRRTLARIWLARCGLARCGLAWYGLAQCGLDRSGPARSEFARGWRPGATIDL